MTLLSVNLNRWGPTNPPVLSRGTLPECHYRFWLVFITFFSIKIYGSLTDVAVKVTPWIGCKCDTMNSRTYWVLINFFRVTLVWFGFISSRGRSFLFVRFHIQANSGANFTTYPKDWWVFFQDHWFPNCVPWFQRELRQVHVGFMDTFL